MWFGGSDLAARETMERVKNIFGEDGTRKREVRVDFPRVEGE